MNEQQFTEWFCKNYPPLTIISDPSWHAPRIYRQLAAAAPDNKKPLSKIQEAFPATIGRKLFDSEMPAVEAFNAKYAATPVAAPRDLTQEEVEDCAKACHGLDMGDSWSLGHDMLAEFAAIIRAIK